MPIPSGEAAWNKATITDFRHNADRIASGPLVGSNLLLLTTVGAKTGETRITPLGYTRDGDRYVVVGSNSGLAHHPAWLANVKADPKVTVEVGAETFAARATVTHGAERKRLWDAHVAAIPMFGNYEKMTERELQVITLERLPGA